MPVPSLEAVSHAGDGLFFVWRPPNRRVDCTLRTSAVLKADKPPSS
jgi:hypothetical protein